MLVGDLLWQEVEASILERQFRASLIKQLITKILKIKVRLQTEIIN